MLIGKEEPAFDHDDYIYELKLDGVRCLAYFDMDYMDLRNKRHLSLMNKFPELSTIYKQVKKKCILDGELYVFKDGINDFFAVQKRCLTSNPFKIRLASKEYPATYTAFDILYYDDVDVRDQPLMKRIQLLHKLIKENERINRSRYIEKEGQALFALTSEQGLEGIVAKHRSSKYHCGKRTKEWIKCKNMLDEDYVVVGYIPKSKGMVSLVLAIYEQGELSYQGHVTMGVSLNYLKRHSRQVNKIPFFNLTKGNEDAIWI